MAWPIPSAIGALSPDGSERAIVCPSLKDAIRFRSTLSGKTRDVRVTGRNELCSITWAADGRNLLVAGKTPEGESALLRGTLDGKASVLLHSSNGEILGAIPSPDGRPLAVAEKSVYNNGWSDIPLCKTEYSGLHFCSQRRNHHGNRTNAKPKS
jgi:hypothetical protein